MSGKLMSGKASFAGSYAEVCVNAENFGFDTQNVASEMHVCPGTDSLGTYTVPMKLYSNNSEVLGTMPLTFTVIPPAHSVESILVSVTGHKRTNPSFFLASG